MSSESNMCGSNQVHVAVSVIIPCYCCSETVERAFMSIIAQSTRPAEVILVEDSSPDGGKTLEILYWLANRYTQYFKIKIITMKANYGAASARNAGWEIATQPYIAFLDSDDAWHPNKVEVQYGFMVSHPDISLSGHLHKVTAQSEYLPSWSITPWKTKELSKLEMLISNRLITPSVMLKRDIDLRFLDGRRHVDDHLLWLELICEKHKIVKLNVELVAVYKFLYGAGGLSSQLWLMEKGELENYKIIKNKGYINLPQWLGLTLYSQIKFVRRLIIYWCLLRWTKR